MSEIVLVTGSNGQLGKEFQALSSKYPDFEFHFFDHSILDICDQNAIENAFQSVRPRYLINCAAYTAVDKAEAEEKKALRVNAEAAVNLAEIASNYDTRMVHFSTDYVFDGSKNTPFSEDDETNPINAYGRSKRQGELQLEKFPSVSIIRTSWLYSSYGSNFVKSMLRLAENRNELRVVADQIGTPTYAADLARTVLNNLSHLGELGTDYYHFSNEGVITWYDFAHAIFEISGKSIKLYPVTTEEYPTAAKRPVYSVLDKRKIKSATGENIPYWRESLKDCLELINKEEE